jgi:hypothetical protein
MCHLDRPWPPTITFSSINRITRRNITSNNTTNNPQQQHRRQPLDVMTVWNACSLAAASARRPSTRPFSSI